MKGNIMTYQEDGGGQTEVWVDQPTMNNLDAMGKLGGLPSLIFYNGNVWRVIGGFYVTKPGLPEYPVPSTREDLVNALNNIMGALQDVIIKGPPPGP
jgi:hypothetical protein